jgi:hypothetical protein
MRNPGRLSPGIPSYHRAVHRIESSQIHHCCELTHNLPHKQHPIFLRAFFALLYSLS